MNFFRVLNIIQIRYLIQICCRRKMYEKSRNIQEKHIELRKKYFEIQSTTQNFDYRRDFYGNMKERLQN